MRRARCLFLQVCASMMFRPIAVFAVAGVLLAGGAHAQTTQLSSLHDALHLTDAQENGWRAYTAAIRPDAGAQARHREAGRLMVTLATPRRVDLINAEMEEDAMAVRRQGEAVKAFYASLTPDQQRTFDRQTVPPSGSGNGQAPSAPQPSQDRLRQPSSNSLPAPN
jgi:hypothetical protein